MVVVELLLNRFATGDPMMEFFALGWAIEEAVLEGTLLSVEWLFRRFKVPFLLD